MAERRDLAEELRLDVLARDEELDGIDLLRERSFDEVFALDREEAGFLSMLARREKLPDEPELLVLP